MADEFQTRKRPAPLAVVAVFGACLFIGVAAILDWCLKLTSPLWGLSELLLLAVILLWRRYYWKHNF